MVSWLAHQTKVESSWYAPWFLRYAEIIPVNVGRDRLCSADHHCKIIPNKSLLVDCLKFRVASKFEPSGFGKTISLQPIKPVEFILCGPHLIRFGDKKKASPADRATSIS